MVVCIGGNGKCFETPQGIIRKDIKFRACPIIIPCTGIVPKRCSAGFFERIINNGSIIVCNAMSFLGCRSDRNKRTARTYGLQELIPLVGTGQEPEFLRQAGKVAKPGCLGLLPFHQRILPCPIKGGEEYLEVGWSNLLPIAFYFFCRSKVSSR